MSVPASWISLVIGWGPQSFGRASWRPLRWGIANMSNPGQNKESLLASLRMSQLSTRKVGRQGWEKSGHRFLSSDYTLLWIQTQVAGDNMDVFKWINFSCSSVKSTWREHKLPVHYNKDMDVTFLLTVVIKNKSVKHSKQYCWQCCLTIILF